VREFFQRSPVSQSDTKQRILRVLTAYLKRNLGIGYAQGMNMVVFCLLAFMREADAFWSLCVMVEDLRLPDFYSRVPCMMNGFQIETATLLHVSSLSFIPCLALPRLSNTHSLLFG
jgi:hypothetical protein